ncbi:MAG: hypothetical protein ILO53_06345, partial [Clostridia bacterium]|nr:hypothetical protein [Clostridia bacterium]
MTRDEFKEALAIAGEKYKTDAAVLRKRAKKQKVLKISIACAAGVFALAAVTAVMLLKRPKTPAANSGNDILLGIEPTQRPEETAEPVNDQPGEAGHESVGDDEHGYPAASASIYGSLANSASIEFNSFDDLQKALNLQNENTLYSYFSGQGIESKQIDNVQIFVNTIRMRNNIVPYLDGDKIELRNEDGFGNITLFS